MPPSSRHASTSRCRSTARRSSRSSASSRRVRRGGLAGGTGGRYFGYVTGGCAAGRGDRRGLDGRGRPERRDVAARAGGRRARAGHDRLARRSARLPGGVGLLRLGRDDGEHRRRSPSRGTGSARKHGVNVAEQGVRALPELAVYASEELHLSDHKALRTLGLGSGCVRTIPIDDALRDARRPARRGDRARPRRRHRAGDRDRAWSARSTPAPPTRSRRSPTSASGTTSGSTSTARSARSSGSGSRPRRSSPGIERADSLAVDGHKWLNVPNGVGFVLLRDAELHREAFAGSAAYLTPGAGANLHELGIEASRSWRGACVWAALKFLGREGMVELVTRCCELAQELARAVEASPRLELTAPAPTNTVCFRYRPEGWPDGVELDDLNRRIQADVVGAGDVFLHRCAARERLLPARGDRLVAHRVRGRPRAALCGRRSRLAALVRALSARASRPSTSAASSTSARCSRC